MEEINDDVETVKPLTPRSAIQEGPRRFPRASVLGFGLLSVFLLAVFIGLKVYCHYSDGVAAADLSAVKANLSSVTEERDRLKANLTEKTREVDRLQSLMEKEKTCPAGWRKFGSSFYLLSTEEASWEQSRDNCTAGGAHLVTVDSEEEQELISSKIMEDTWIGLSDREEEGTWKWVDGSPLNLNLTFWVKGEPSNGGVGEEDCAVIKPDTKRWNDQPCKDHIYWICEKEA
ncbi:C-type lectin domain family 4 member E-like [Trematomus bernacchii]|uniref:C-type lectin domain family 4 member E-like n=1 Tax=Trematomus bernacchii TaxID=40690 RepID=UPI00146CC543|nr:C-type lectin domain family 4 member E-like [Trematomus bernacchii]